MELKFIKTKECPHCGCKTVVSESLECDSRSSEVRTHVNGQRFEQRAFLCGHAVQWSPNFEREETRPLFGECKRSKDFKEKENKRKAAAEKLLKALGRLDVDETFKEVVTAEINRWSR